MVSALRDGLVTEFIGHPREVAWTRAYVDACNAARDARRVAIYDISDVPANTDSRLKVALLFRVLRAAEVKRKAVQDQVQGDCARQVADGQLTLGLSPFGDNAEDAAEALYQAVGHPPGGMNRWIAGASTQDELRQLLAEWLLLVIDRRLPPDRPADELAMDSEAVLAEEMPTTAEGTDSTRPRRFRGMP